MQIVVILSAYFNAIYGTKGNYAIGFHVSSVDILTSNVVDVAVYDVVINAVAYVVVHYFGKIFMDFVAVEIDCHVNFIDIDIFHNVFMDSDQALYL